MEKRKSKAEDTDDPSFVINISQVVSMQKLQHINEYFTIKSVKSQLPVRKVHLGLLKYTVLSKSGSFTDHYEPR